MKTTKLHSWSLYANTRNKYLCQGEKISKNAVTTVETRVQEANLSAMDNFVVPRMELVMRSVGISSVPNLSSEALDRDRRDFSGDTNGLQMTASSRLSQTQT